MSQRTPHPYDRWRPVLARFLAGIVLFSATFWIAMDRVAPNLWAMRIPRLDGEPSRTKLPASAANFVPNDSCTEAVEVFDGVTFYDILNSTWDGESASCGAVSRDIWFRYTASCTGLLRVVGCADSYDPIVTIYEDQVCDPLGPELDCSDIGCDENLAAQALVIDTSLYLIRVGADAGIVEGVGTLAIECEEVCGVPTAGDCCTAHDPDIACDNELCCRIVCSIAGEGVCCLDWTVGWDSECAQVARELAACRCPCPLDCPTGAQREADSCGQDTNAGCGSEPAQPISYSDLGLLPSGSRQTACGTVQADQGVRDTDWWAFQVVDHNGDGEAELTLTVTANAPVGVQIVRSSQTPSCDDNADGRRDDPVILDAVATAACQAQTLTICVPADEDGEPYVAFVSTFETPGEGVLGAPLYDGVACTTDSPDRRNDYSFTLTARDTCKPGACCNCSGGCTAGISEVACQSAGGAFAGENTSCAALPPDACNVVESCGSCRLFGDHVSSYCRVDVDDLLCVLQGFVEFDQCPSADQYPCGGDRLIDVDDIVAEIQTFSGYYLCPHPCPGGACCADFPGGETAVECRDMTFFPGGMSRADCALAGGIYHCDGSFCPVDDCTPE